MKRNTKQKQIILESLKNRTDHPTAKILYKDLKKEMPSIGLATIYRNLSTLVEAGEILKIKTENGEDRFDGNINPHLHFKCIKCNELKDIFLQKDEFDKIDNEFNKIVQNMNYDINSWEVNITGICEKCNKQEGKV